jgi:transposase
VRRAQIILASAAGETDTEIAQRFGVSIQTVGHWRRRFHRHGRAGLSDAPRSGRLRTHDDERVAKLLRTVLASRPKAGTHWSVRTVAAETGISKSTVARYFALFGVQPHRTRSFSLSTDPLFAASTRSCSTTMPASARSPGPPPLTPSSPSCSAFCVALATAIGACSGGALSEPSRIEGKASEVARRYPPIIPPSCPNLVFCVPVPEP